MVRRVDVQAVPAWPVIGLSFDGETAVADPAGVGDPIRVAAYPDLATAAASASVAAARRLNVTRCRVQGVGADGESWLMVVDTAAGTLEELDTGGEAAARHGGGAFSGVSRRLSAVPSRWWLVIGVAAVCVVAVAVVVVPRAMLPEPVAAGDDAAAVEQEAPKPPAGQLPVPAPVGWDTYAGWVVDANKPGSAAVLAGSDTLVIVDAGTVIGLNADTGQERWRAGTPGDVTQLFVPAGEGIVYAERARQGVSVLDAETGRVIANADIAAEQIGLGDIPFAQLPGQAGAVLVGESWERRQVPATSLPVGTVGDGLVSVSIEQQRLWVTTSDSPVLPAPVQLESPAEGVKLSRVVAFTDAHLVTEWTDGFGARTLAVDVVDAAGQLERVGTREAVSGGAGTATVDAVAGLVGIGRLLLDVQTTDAVIAPQGSVLARAGFGWTEQAGNKRVRISEDGTMLPMSSGAVVPDVILPDGRAVVRAARGADGQAYYVLEVEQPTSTATPEPTPTDERDSDGND